jgi:hypothetical protein
MTSSNRRDFESLDSEYINSAFCQVFSGRFLKKPEIPDYTDYEAITRIINALKNMLLGPAGFASESSRSQKSQEKLWSGYQ